MLRKNLAADNILKYFFVFQLFLKNIIWHFMQIVFFVSFGDNLYETLNPIF